MNKYSVRRDKHIEYGFWLIFDGDGSVRLLRGSPSLGRGERAMSVTATLPLALFSTPQLKATLTVESPDTDPIRIDMRAASEALSMAIGVDVDLQVNNLESKS